MRATVVGFDIDGVLADFGYEMLKTARGMGYPVEATPTGAYLGWSPTALTDADIAKVWAEIDTDDAFWRRLPSLLSDAERAFMWRMQALGTDFCYITSRPEYATRATQYWLEGQEIPGPRSLRVTGYKLEAIAELGVEYFIDDKPSNILELAPWTRMHIMDWPYNRVDVEPRLWGIPRVSSVGEFLAIAAREVGYL